MLMLSLWLVPAVLVIVLLMFAVPAWTREDGMKEMFSKVLFFTILGFIPGVNILLLILIFAGIIGFVANRNFK